MRKLFGESNFFNNDVKYWEFEQFGFVNVGYQNLNYDYFVLVNFFCNIFGLLVLEWNLQFQ